MNQSISCSMRYGLDAFFVFKVKYNKNFDKFEELFVSIDFFRDI